MPKCQNCERPLVCKYCGTKLDFPNKEAYETFYERLRPVRCPRCEFILVCESCGYTYDAGEYEFGEQER